MKNKIKSNNWIRYRFVRMSLMKHNNFIFFSDKEVYILSRQQKLHPTGSPMKLDYLIILIIQKYLGNSFKVFDTHLVIIDETNSFYSKKSGRAIVNRQKSIIHFRKGSCRCERD